MKYDKKIVASALFILIALSPLWGASGKTVRQLVPDIRKSTVKIICTFAGYDYCDPWKMKSHNTKVGSGAIIKGNMVLTNAHVISDATFIQVQKENDPVLYNASVLHVSHESDLALLKVDDPGFFMGAAGLDFGGLPQLRSSVVTYGYPVGGERISITEGVISRIEIGIYAHDGKSSFLMIQTDAAINPGNSGGPAIQDGKIVGLAFQIITKTSNIGYLIPVSVIKHFLLDVRDGIYDGFPSLGIQTEKLQNRSYRDYLGMSDLQTGIVVTGVLADGSSGKFLEKDDVIMEIDHTPVANDGSIPLSDGRIDYIHLVYTKQAGETADLKILRDKKEKIIKIPVKTSPERISWRNIYDRKPRYIIFSGIVFQPLSHEYVKCWGKWSDSADPDLLYKYYFHNADLIDLRKKEFVVISHVLPDAANTYITDIHDKLVVEINGFEINKMEDIKPALEKPAGEYHLIKLEGVNKPVLLKVSETGEADRRIMRKYRINVMTELDNLNK